MYSASLGMTATPRSPRWVHPSAKPIIASFSALIAGVPSSGRRVISAVSTLVGSPAVTRYCRTTAPSAVSSTSSLNQKAVACCSARLARWKGSVARAESALIR